MNNSTHYRDILRAAAAQRASLADQVVQGLSNPEQGVYEAWFEIVDTIYLRYSKVEPFVLRPEYYVQNYPHLTALSSVDVISAISTVVDWLRLIPTDKLMPTVDSLDQYRRDEHTERRSAQRRETLGAGQGVNNALQGLQIYAPAGQSREKRFRGYISGEDDLLAKEKQFSEVWNQEKPAVDFPEDKYEQQRLVKILFEAMVNLEGIIDNPTTRKATERQTTRSAAYPVHPEAGREYGSRVKAIWEVSDFALEALAWELLFRIRDAQRGVLHLDMWHNPTRWKYVEYPTFEARFDATVEALRTSKAITHNLMEVPYLARNALAPEEETKRKISNNQGNTKKGEQQEVGREAIKRKRHTADVGGRFAGSLSVPSPSATPEDSFVLTPHPDRSSSLAFSPENQPSPVSGLHLPHSHMEPARLPGYFDPGSSGGALVPQDAPNRLRHLPPGDSAGGAGPSRRPTPIRPFDGPSLNNTHHAQLGLQLAPLVHGGQVLDPYMDFGLRLFDEGDEGHEGAGGDEWQSS